MTILEAYKNRLAVAESVYSRSHNGEKMDNMRKLMVAKCIQNTDNYLREQFENSVGTQRSAMGD